MLSELTILLLKIIFTSSREISFFETGSVQYNASLMSIFIILLDMPFTLVVKFLLLVILFFIS